MITLENTYASLPERFHSKVSPEKLPELVPIALNKELAQELFGKKIETYSDSQLSALFSGQEVIPNSEPIALAYAGHQFGHFSAALGDGRALLLGEAVSTTDNKRYDIQLKGSGRTPYSRNGDGKSSLGPVIREYLVSEAMFHLGIPTTRSLAAFSSGEYVFREDRLPGGLFTRVASSHVRIGTFEFFASRGDLEAVKILADYSIERHYPSAKTFENPYLQFLKCVAEAQSSLVAQWMAVGFIHGVM
ncbi:MAG: hypothetical protein HOM21_00155, partial [Halobacteriovoraceae bacterium]|nr:hypothetical protein [Halobacteriovoraceae bacterium]